MKKLLSMLLLAVMLLSLCAQALAADEIVDGRFTETRHITVEIYDRSNDGGSDPTNNVFTDYIKEGMLRDHNVAVEYIRVPRWTEDSEINNLLSSGEAPDVCVTYSYPTIQTYATMGGVVDLAPYLEANKALLPDLWALLGDTNIYYDRDPEVGTVWALEALLAQNMRINTFVRKDWLDKLNMPLPTTEAEFKEMLIAFRDNAELLLGADADKLIPYSTSFDVGWRNDHLTTSYIAEGITDKERYVFGFDDRRLLYPNYKEGIRVLNEWYNEGLIWKDFALYGAGETTEDNMMKAGYIGAFMHNWDYPYRNGDDSIQSNLIRNIGPEACYVAVESFKNDAGIYRKFLSAPVDRKVFFPATNDEPVASLLYLNFLAKQENLYFLQTGFKDINHVVQDNGAIKTLPVTGDYIMNSGNNIDYTIVVNGLRTGDATIDAMSIALGYPGTDPELIQIAATLNRKDAVYGKNYQCGKIESEEGMGTALKEKRDAFLCQAIVAPVDQFDAVYDGGMADYLSSGGQDIIDERAAAYLKYYGE